jgi:hypothetical protein
LQPNTGVFNPFLADIGSGLHGVDVSNNTILFSRALFNISDDQGLILFQEI